MEIIQAKPKPVYVKPPGSKPRRLGWYFYQKTTYNDAGTILVWVTGEGYFKAVHPISGQWLSEDTLHRVLYEAALDMPGSSDAVQKLAFDTMGGVGIQIFTVRYDFQHKAWYLDGTAPGVPRKFVQQRLYEIPDGQTLVDLAHVYAQRQVLEQAGSVHWRAITSLRPFNERNTDIAQQIVKRMIDATVPERQEPQIPEASAPDVAATDTAAP